jgi:alanyl-tRNA synthetase
MIASRIKKRGIAMTEKLYYADSHLRCFTAAVLSCTPAEEGWEVILSATAFYPEGGGQACDLGKLGDANVLDVRERGEEIIHLCDAPLEAGLEVTGAIDWERRFSLMQQHSGEHIVSGIIHRRYGYHNKGFHMGSDIITIDFDGVVPGEDLADIEAEANRAVWENVELRCWYPSPEELPGVFYRTKKALPWPVRIVEVPGYDSCACCGTHVKRTGEIGLIKLFSTVGFRGGTRMEMACGGRALALLNTALEQNKLVSQAFSAHWTRTGEAAQLRNTWLEAEKFKIVGLQRKLMASTAESYVNHGDVLHFEDGLDPVLVREYADAIAEKCRGMAAVFSGEEGSYSYCLVTRNGDLRTFGKAMTAALKGRGGGKPICQQGRVSATRAEIEGFFRENGI